MAGRPGRAAPVTDAQRAELLRLHALRHPLDEIYRIVGISRASAGFILQAADSARDWTLIDPIIRDMHAAHASTHTIARTVRVGVEIIGHRIHLLGLTRGSIRLAHDRVDPPRPRNVVSHGVEGYSAGCRCAECREASRAGGRRRQQATVPTATAHGLPWTAEDDEIALDETRSLTEIAIELGRTYRAVDGRRAKLRKK